MSDKQLATSEGKSIHPATSIGLVALRVAQLDRSIRFYTEVLGFQVLEQRTNHVVLGPQDRQPLLELIELPGAAPQPRRATGLYHVAVLLPTRPDLGRLLVRMINAGLRIGQGDHLVSEALYISDPDENGLELYRDRPRNTWTWENATVKMATDPVDIEGLVAEGEQKADPWNILPTGTTVGHIHLQVGNLQQAEHFYHTILGFDVTCHYPGALFVSAGGYHHHIGLNTWHSLNAAPTPAHAAGLQFYQIIVPTLQALQEVQARLIASHIEFEEQDNTLIVLDPWHNRLCIKVVNK